MNRVGVRSLMTGMGWIAKISTLPGDPSPRSLMRLALVRWVHTHTSSGSMV